MEIRAVVVIKVPLWFDRVRAKVVLLTRIVRPVGRAGLLDPDLARRMLKAPVARWHVRHPVTAVSGKEKAPFEFLIDEICPLVVTGARQAKSVNEYLRILEMVLEVRTSNSSHSRTK